MLNRPNDCGEGDFEGWILTGKLGAHHGRISRAFFAVFVRPSDQKSYENHTRMNGQFVISLDFGLLWGVGQTPWRQPNDGSEVAQTQLRRRSADGPHRGAFNRLVRRRRGDDRRVPAAYAAAAR
jgi:hypothetical protein